MSFTSSQIFKRDSVGKTRVWFFETDGGRYRTHAGILGGNLVVSAWTTCKPKNVGRANETTAEQQARAEAEAEMKKKLDREYRATIKELDDVPTSPMLANDYAKLKKPLVFPVYSQPKLDGIRATARADGMFSREYQRHFNCDHIMEALEPLFKRFPGIQFDGELYNHDLKDDFNQITTLVRREKLTAAQKDAVVTMLQYHIYDLPSQDDFSHRFNKMKLLHDMSHTYKSDIIRFVPTNMVETSAGLDLLYGRYLEDGYEGQMIRLDEPYDFDKRSPYLLKRKEFATEEYPLARIEEGQGNWAGYAKRIIFTLPDGREVGAGLRGSQAYAKELLDRERAGNRPKIVTIRRFAQLTPDGIPRFPVAIDFHEEARVD